MGVERVTAVRAGRGRIGELHGAHLPPPGRQGLPHGWGTTEANRPGPRVWTGAKRSRDHASPSGESSHAITDRLP